MAKYNGKKVASVVKTIPVAVEIEANPNEQATDELNKIKVGNKVYDNPPFVEGSNDESADEVLTELRVRKGNVVNSFNVKPIIEEVDINDYYDEGEDLYYLSFDDRTTNLIVILTNVPRNGFSIEVEPPYPCYGVVFDSGLIARSFVNKRPNEKQVQSFNTSFNSNDVSDRNIIIDFTGGFAKVYLAIYEM